MIIDTQVRYCDPSGKRGNSQTYSTARKIAELTPEFCKAGIPIYAIYFNHANFQCREDVDFYQFKSAKQDLVIGKESDSAFRECDLEDILNRDGRKRLLVCGFNLSACVYKTVMDALKERRPYEVCLLTDLTGNDNTNDQGTGVAKLRDMRNREAVIAKSDQVLRHFKKR